MTDAEKVAMLREALAPFVYAYEDALVNGTQIVVANPFFRHAQAAMRATDSEEPK